MLFALFATTFVTIGWVMSGTALASQLTVTGVVKAGAPCLIIVSDSGKLHSLKGVKRNAVEIGARYTVTGTPLRISNCQQGTTLQVENISLQGG